MVICREKVAYNVGSEVHAPPITHKSSKLFKNIYILVQIKYYLLFDQLTYFFIPNFRLQKLEILTFI